MNVKVTLQTTGDVGAKILELASLHGTTYLHELGRTLERAGAAIDRVLLSAAQRRLEELRGKPAPVITEVVL